MSLESVRSQFSYLMGAATDVVKAIEPYQPTIAVGIILGKIGWRLYQYKPMKREIETLSSRLHIRNAIVADPRLDPERAARIRTEIRELKAKKLEKERQLDITKLTLGQVPSLFFSHPGANEWTSTHQIVSRVVQMHHIAHSLPQEEWSSWKKGMYCALGVLALAGTSAALLRQTGMISENNAIATIVSRVGLGVSIIEGALIAKSTVESYFKPPNRDLAERSSDLRLLGQHGPH